MPVLEDVHGAEFEDRELSTVESLPSLREDHRSGGFQLDQHANDEEKRRQRDEQALARTRSRARFSAISPEDKGGR